MASTTDNEGGTESEFSSEAADKFSALLPGFDLAKLKEDGETGASRTSQQAVFPGFPTNMPAPKSRRKPAFVRRVGAESSRNSAQASKRTQDERTLLQTGDNESGSSGNLAEDGGKTDVSASQEAAVDALIRMATGADHDDMDMSDQSAGFDVTFPGMLLKQTLLAAGKPTSSSSNTTRGTHGISGRQQQRSSVKFTSPDSSGGGGGGGGGGGLRNSGGRQPSTTPTATPGSGTILSSLIRTNTRVSLVDFTAEDLLRHLMSRDDVYRCDFCRVIFHDAALYHLHRSMHDKMDIRCCNLCGKLAVDKYDFTAHFLTQHK
nr:hypothetical protein BaRGS_020686 [Batillaria attramentaria]